MTEAWIFLSIGDAGGDKDWASLDAVIGMADANNHSIPTADELGKAVSKLVAAGLVQTQGSATRLTREGCKAYLRANSRRVGYIERFLDLANEWRASGYPKEAPTSWSVDEDTWRASWGAYRERFREMYEELKARKDHADDQ